MHLRYFEVIFDPKENSLFDRQSLKRYNYNTNIKRNLSKTTQMAMDKKVIIVGAGASGIAAATKLLSNGFNNVTILEASTRIGGRINTVPFGANVVDMGAEQ